MKNSTNEGPAIAYGKYLYEVGRKGVGGNSIIPFTVTRCTKNVAVRRDDWVIDSILQLDSKKIVSFPPMKAL